MGSKVFGDYQNKGVGVCQGISQFDSTYLLSIGSIGAIVVVVVVGVEEETTLDGLLVVTSSWPWTRGRM